jgi:hypothetical protein
VGLVDPTLPRDGTDCVQVRGVRRIDPTLPRDGTDCIQVRCARLIDPTLPRDGTDCIQVRVWGWSTRRYRVTVLTVSKYGCGAGRPDATA